MESSVIENKKKLYRRSKVKQNSIALLLISPYVIIFILFSVIPLFAGIIMSFMQYNPYNSEVNQFIGFDNYTRLFNFDFTISKQFWNSFGTMFLFDLVAVPCLIIIPLILAYLVNLRPPLYKLFRAIIYLPSVVSISIVGIIFGNLFAAGESGLINSWFHTNITWLGGQPFSNDILRWIVILIASIWWQTGTNFVIFLGALRDVPKSLYEACEMDGGNRRKLIRFVTIPNIKTSISICMFNTLIGYLGLYGQVIALNEMENQNVMVSPMQFIQNYLSKLEYGKVTGYICACACIYGLVVVFFSILERRVMSYRKVSNKFSRGYYDYNSDIKYLENI